MKSFVCCSNERNVCVKNERKGHFKETANRQKKNNEKQKKKNQRFRRSGAKQNHKIRYRAIGNQILDLHLTQKHHSQ